MTITLDHVFKTPSQYRFNLTNRAGESFILRPLEKNDEKKLTILIASLSDDTQYFYSYVDMPEEISREHIAAINKYDKLRFVLEKESIGDLVGLFEFSFDIPKSDLDRFSNYDIALLPTDCRIGPLLKDDYQSKGLGSLVLPLMIDIARQFERNRIILWGGVYHDNLQAIRFYEKNGFVKVGTYVDLDEIENYDMLRTI